MIKCLILNLKKIESALVLTDFEKAFDSMSWSFIYEFLDYFGFGDDLISKCIYRENQKL